MTIKIMKVKLEYWLPGITIGASGARQPVDIRGEVPAPKMMHSVRIQLL